MKRIERDVLTTGQAAKICHVSYQTVNRLIDRGILKGFRIPGSKHRRVRKSDLAELIQNYRVTAGKFFLKEQGISERDSLDSRIRILVIDSQEGLASKIGNILVAKEKYYQIQSVDSNFSAGMIVEEFKPHIILINLLARSSDIALGASSLCSVVKNRKDSRVIKVVAVTDNSQSVDLLQSGFDGYILSSGGILDTVLEIVLKIERIVRPVLENSVQVPA